MSAAISGIEVCASQQTTSSLQQSPIGIPVLLEQAAIPSCATWAAFSPGAGIQREAAGRVKDWTAAMDFDSPEYACAMAAQDFPALRFSP